MTWFKLDEKSTFHAKVIAAGNQAWGALCRAGTWCSEHGTDGLFTSDIALVIEPARKVWAKLESVGLIHATDRGWSIHDFTVYNPTAQEVLEKREARAKSGSAGGRRSGEVRSNSKQEPSKNEAIASPVASPLLRQCSPAVEAKTNPDPDPDTDQSKIRDPEPSPVAPAHVRGRRRINPDAGESPKQMGEHARVIAAFDERFLEARGERPVWTPRELGAAKKLRIELGTDKAIDVIRAAYATAYGRTKSLSQLAADPNQWLGVKATASNATPRVQRERDSEAYEAIEAQKRAEHLKGVVPVVEGEEVPF
jgi:hypothetical protein